MWYRGRSTRSYATWTRATTSGRWSCNRGQKHQDLRAAGDAFEGSYAPVPTVPGRARGEGPEGEPLTESPPSERFDAQQTSRTSQRPVSACPSKGGLPAEVNRDDILTCDERLMANPPPIANLPWCPNCKQPLGPPDIGQMQVAGAGFSSAGLSIVFCRRCGVILGPATGRL